MAGRKSGTIDGHRTLRRFFGQDKGWTAELMVSRGYVVSEVGEGRNVEATMQATKSNGQQTPSDKQEIVLLHRAAESVASVANRLNQAGHVASVAHSELAFWQVMHARVSVVLLELAIPGNEGMRLLQRIRERFPEARVVVTFAEPERSRAVASLEAGASEYLREPLDVALVVTHILQAAQANKLARDNQELRSLVNLSVPVPRMAGRSAKFRAVLEQISRAACLDSAVLLYGEPGTGKSTLARMIHQQGPRSHAPFVILSCGSLPRELVEAELFGHTRGALGGAPYERPGRAEMAHGGTLFLDDVSELPFELQPRLLSLLQEQVVQRIGGTERRRVDVRVVAASTSKLEALCEAKTFLPDLFRRLSVMQVNVPSLRDRIDDLPDLATNIVHRISTRRGLPPVQITPDAQARLAQHPWPGNIGELEQVLERALGLSREGRLTSADLQLELPGHGSAHSPSNLAGLTLAEVEKHAIVDTLQACNGNKARAARELGISEKSIYNKMKRLGIPKHIVRTGYDSDTPAASPTLV